ncbi:fumarylacetoacetate hydrolase family protein [Sulfobacillus harzensis]|uniref:Fumarylacetoacetate hydrolase family protein n=1 Tax=Sulfobacillus harzensis TaxID=2729629 RepID=A0A7Y0L6E6_9FIRM|nr:fumarylacetoacetate hydrolase family protein [Sulfobacillus harzensis]NMP22779.1 fumarylacetoacetate hydrolase family protein [Sulfobacillus harzensis]
MKLACAEVHHHQELAIVTEGGVYAADGSMADILRRGDEGLQELKAQVREAEEGRRQPLEQYRLLPPVPEPGKIICVGLNYRPHVAEGHFEIPTHPVLFNKYVSSLVGDGATVRAPGDSEQLDYEAELVIVMGRRAQNVSEQDALNYVFGYTNGNDLSARDLQFRTPQWLLGKAADGLAPIGPYIVTADEVPNPDHLEIRGYRNGQLVQHSNTDQMIFSCRFLISYISRYITLEPGDLLFTGTPEGVIMGQDPAARKWLSPGETLTVAVEGLGELTTHIG